MLIKCITKPLLIVKANAKNANIDLKAKEKLKCMVQVCVRGR